MSVSSSQEPKSEKPVDLGARSYSLQMWVDQELINYVKNDLGITEDEAFLKGRMSEEVI